MALPPPSSPLLRLPKELRYQIYDHLCRQEPKSYPFAHTAIAFIDQRGPPTALLITCRYLCEEIRTYFYSNVTLGFVAESSAPLPERGTDDISLEAVQHARKVSVRLTWHDMPSRDGVARNTWLYSVRGWLSDLVDLLLEKAECLEVITVTVCKPEPAWVTDWAVDWLSADGLTPLERIAGRVRFRVGDVFAADEEEEAHLRERLAVSLKELNGVMLPGLGS
jgi:hypothetical protein